MAPRWRVIRNYGNRAELSHFLDGMEIKRPAGVSEEEFYEMLRPGSVITNRVLMELKKIWGISTSASAQNKAGGKPDNPS